MLILRRFLLLSLGILLIGHSATAQRRPKPVPGQPRYHTGIYHPRPPKKAPAYQIAYVGFGGGINNPFGLANFNIDFPFTQHISLCFGAGLSTWGYKSGAEARYYFDSCNRGWAAMIGFSYNNGRNGLVLNGVETTTGEQSVTIDQKSVTSVSFSIGYFFNLGLKGTNRFHLQAGYSIPLLEPEFINRNSGFQAPLTDKGHNTIQALAPGGPVLGLGFSFGTGRHR